MIILTAGTEAQRALAEKLISTSDCTARYGIVCVTDFMFAGKHLGSGGAVLHILRKFWSPGKKLVIINSGGECRRSINYSIRGKAFADIVCGEHITSLLDKITENVGRLLENVTSGVLIYCSDILFDIKNTVLENGKNYAFGIKTNMDIAQNHGVYFCRDGLVSAFLHKKSKEELLNFDPDCDKNGVITDTGTIFLCEKTAAELLSAAENTGYFEKNEEINLYNDILPFVFGNASTGSATGELIAKDMGGIKMYPIVVDGGGFLHFGTIKESLENIVALNSSANIVSLNAKTDGCVFSGQNTVLNNAYLKNCVVGKNCFVSDIILSDVKIPDNTCVCGIRLKNGKSVAICVSIEENPKTEINGIQLWDTPRFYASDTFTQSFNDFYSQKKSAAVSMSQAVNDADYDSFYNLRKYISEMSLCGADDVYLSLRRKIIDISAELFNEITEVSCLYNKIEISLPVRINLSGTWTDAMPYCTENGGCVINAAVTADGELPVNVVVEKRTDGRIMFGSDDIFTFYDFSDDGFDDFSDFSLHRAVLKILGISSKTVIKDGFTLSASVKNIQKGSGLGVSSILLSGCIKALCTMLGVKFDTDKIINAVFVAEQIMGTGGGWQDQAGGFIPGIKIVSSCPGIVQRPVIKRIVLSDGFRAFFKDRLFLVPTGKRHYGRFIVTNAANRYLEKNNEAMSAYREMYILNDRLTKAIENDDFLSFAQCINRHHELLRLITPLSSDIDIDNMRSRLLDICDGVSVLGAGGGGYLLAVAKSGITKDIMCDFIKDKFPSITAQIKQIDICENTDNERRTGI